MRRPRLKLGSPRLLIIDTAWCNGIPRRRAVVGKPSRSLCQDVAPHLDLTQFAAQLDELMALAGTKRTGLRRRQVAGPIGLANPVQDAGGVTAKLLGQFAGLPARSNQFNHLLAKLRQIGRLEVCGLDTSDSFCKNNKVSANWGQIQVQLYLWLPSFPPIC